MTYLFMVLFAVFILAIDQITKFLTVANITLFGRVDFLPGIVSLTYVQNDGAAFSMLEGQQWLFAVVFAGGLGNMFDRLRLGYVVDMISTDFMNFPVFNVADIFITCGCILLMLHLIFFNKEFWKDEKK